MKGINSNWKVAMLLLIGVLLVTVLPLGGTYQAQASPGTIYVPDNYPTIQRMFHPVSLKIIESRYEITLSILIRPNE